MTGESDVPPRRKTYGKECILSVPFSGSYTSSLGLQESLSSTLNCHVPSQGVKYLLQSVPSQVRVNREPGGAPSIQFHPVFFTHMQPAVGAGSRLFTSQHLIVCAKQMRTASLGETERELPRITCSPLTGGKTLGA